MKPGNKRLNNPYILALFPGMFPGFALDVNVLR